MGVAAGSNSAGKRTVEAEGGELSRGEASEEGKRVAYADDKESNSGLEAEAEVVTDCWEFAAEAEVKAEVMG
jgi:hypothetical protein